jgi:hypothetical protein
MSELYSHLFEDVDMRLAEAEAAGYGFDLPDNPSRNVVVAPNAPRNRITAFETLTVSA